MKVTGQPPGVAPVKAGAARAAQRAFFDAALQQAAPAAQTRSAVAAPQPALGRAVQPKVTPVTVDPPPSGRLLRPGSLLDIKV